MNHEDLKAHIDGRFDRIEYKIDDHLERISRSEEAIQWLKGHVKITTTLVITAIGSVIAGYFSIT
jgi:hypothetical protein